MTIPRIPPSVEAREAADRVDVHPNLSRAHKAEIIQSAITLATSRLEAEIVEERALSARLHEALRDQNITPYASKLDGFVRGYCSNCFKEWASEKERHLKGCLASPTLPPQGRV